MTPEEYRKALERLDLTVASKATATALGMTIRHAQRVAAGTRAVHPAVALLLRMYLRHGIPKELR